MSDKARFKKISFSCPNWCDWHDDEERSTGDTIGNIVHMAKTADVLPDREFALGAPSWDGFTATLCTSSNEDGVPGQGRVEIVIDQSHYNITAPHAVQQLEEELESMLHALRAWRGIMEVEQSLTG
ncbi:hypothetical protein ACFYWS_20490 [Streptomyces sp. NPDC002795]|uniref:hypothetical protein n=1 Tax=Streptomyces sp. NPDC002795 TaxID=3364665 RepID=UPI0036787C8C